MDRLLLTVVDRLLLTVKVLFGIDQPLALLLGTTWVATFLPFAQNIVGDVLTEAARLTGSPHPSTVPVHSAMSE